MPQPYEFNVADEQPVECDNCEWKGTGKELKPILHLMARIEPGEIVPAGECPECGCLAHLSEPYDTCPDMEVADLLAVHKLNAYKAFIDKFFARFAAFADDEEIDGGDTVQEVGELYQEAKNLPGYRS